MIRFLAGVYPAIMFAIAAFFFWKLNLEKVGILEIQKKLKEKGLR
jgi:Na+/melibiose symporter-like transporter